MFGCNQPVPADENAFFVSLVYALACIESNRAPIMTVSRNRSNPLSGLLGNWFFRLRAHIRVEKSDVTMITIVSATIPCLLLRMATKMIMIKSRNFTSSKKSELVFRLFCFYERAGACMHLPLHWCEPISAIRLDEDGNVWELHRHYRQH